MSRYRRTRRGYTIVELITVVVIVAVLAVVSLPAFSNLRKGARLKASARRVTSALRYARRMAITMNGVYSVMFSQANRTFGIIDGTSGSDTVEKRFTLDETISFRVGIPSSISFKANGSVKGEGNPGTIFIESIDGSVYRVTVVGTSGRVRIYEGE